MEVSIKYMQISIQKYLDIWKYGNITIIYVHCTGIGKDKYKGLSKSQAKTFV